MNELTEILSTLWYKRGRHSKLPMYPKTESIEEAEQAIEAHYAKRFEDALGPDLHVNQDYAAEFQPVIDKVESLNSFRAEARKRYYQDNTEMTG